MVKKAKISIDLMSGENSPDKTLEGIDLFIKRNKSYDDFFFYLCGDANIINEKIRKFNSL